MKQTALNFLGYSSFSAMVLIGSAAQAEVPPSSVGNVPLYAGYVNSASTDSVPTDSAAVVSEEQANLVQQSNLVKRSNCSCQQAMLDLNSDDAVGDLAIEQLGCDCAGCRYTVVRMAQNTLE